MSRISTRTRKTKETDISLMINIDGTGKSEIDTGIGFFDHMLVLFARHGFFDLTVKCKGDTEVDFHHSVEDVGITLDGKKGYAMKSGDILKAEKAGVSVKLIQAPGKNYYQTLRKKLHWGH